MRKWPLSQVQGQLKSVLGGTYGGPSLAYSSARKKFIIYEWTDAPIGIEEHAEGDTIEDAIVAFMNKKVRKLVRKRA